MLFPPINEIPLLSFFIYLNAIKTKRDASKTIRYIVHYWQKLLVFPTEDNFDINYLIILVILLSSHCCVLYASKSLFCSCIVYYIALY